MVQPHRRALMEGICDLPDSTDVDPDGPLRLVRVEYVKGGEEIATVDVYDRVEWLEKTQDDDTWRALARQSFDDYDVSENDGHRLVQVELPGWWVDSEREDAGPHDTTWHRSYGKVYGEAETLAVADYQWAEGKAAWSFPHVKHKDRGWHSPGKFGPSGPKSLLPITMPVGEPRPVDTESVSAREAREAAPNSEHTPDYDWEAAVEKAEDRADARTDAEDVEMDLSAVTTLTEHGQAVKAAGNKALIQFRDDYQDEHGVEPDPVTLTVAAEAIGRAVRGAKNLDDPRGD